MAININAKTSGVGGLETTADNSGNINIQSGGSTVMSVTSSGVAVTGSFSQNGAVYSTQPTFRNRIINGDMRIDQRNAGASVTPTTDGTYTLDRWTTRISAASKFSVQKNAGAVTPPAGFINYLGVTSLAATSVGSTDYYAVSQFIEGLNTADLGFGTANAQTVTLSFWVRSSLTGTFGGYISNSSGGRIYPFSYTISSANTWEKKSITIAGDTAGTWLTTSGIGIRVQFNLGFGSTYQGAANAWNSSNIFQPTGATSVVGTSGATFYLTGVQLEAGSTATEFEHRPYDMELARCQRYYEKSYNISQSVGASTSAGQEYFQVAGARNINYGLYTTHYKVPKRASCTVTLYSQNGTSGYLSNGDSGANLGTGGVLFISSENMFVSKNTGSTIADGTVISYQWTAESEL